MKITKKLLEELNTEADVGFLNPVLDSGIIEDEIELRKLTEWALAEGKIDKIRWIFSRLLTPEKAVLWSIKCVRHMCKIPEWLEWAEKWESGTDRTGETAEKISNSLWDFAEGCLSSNTDAQARAGARVAEAATYMAEGSRHDVATSVYVATGLAAFAIYPLIIKSDEDIVSETRWQIERAYELLEV